MRFEMHIELKFDKFNINKDCRRHGDEDHPNEKIKMKT